MTLTLGPAVQKLYAQLQESEPKLKGCDIVVIVVSVDGEVESITNADKERMNAILQHTAKGEKTGFPVRTM